MKILYACGVDWQCEIGEAGDLEGRMPLFSSVKQLKAQGRCWRECGIVALKVTAVGWPVEQKLGRAPRRKRPSRVK